MRNRAVNTSSPYNQCASQTRADAKESKTLQVHTNNALYKQELMRKRVKHFKFLQTMRFTTARAGEKESKTLQVPGLQTMRFTSKS